MFATPSYAERSSIQDFSPREIAQAILGHRDNINKENEQLMPQGMWRDPNTGLIWQRCSLGQTWNGYGCTGDAKLYSFKKSQQAVKKLGSGWRVPAASELASLVRCTTGFSGKRQLPDHKGVMKNMRLDCNEGSVLPTIDATVFPATEEGQYWSSSLDSEQKGRAAWSIDFGAFHSGTYGLKSAHHIRAVRSSR